MKYLDEEIESFLRDMVQRIAKMKLRRFQHLVSETIFSVCCSVPEENRDLAGYNICANFAFSRKIAIFRKFCFGAQFLRKFATLLSAIFRKVRKFCNLLAN